MKAAFAVWNHRIAPVFDFARQILLVEVESGVSSARPRSRFRAIRGQGRDFAWSSWVSTRSFAEPFPAPCKPWSQPTASGSSRSWGET
jgi:hypothetical protein